MKRPAFLLARSRRPRVRCKRCGSTRVRGIVAAYCDGPVKVNEQGHMAVTDGAFEVHMDGIDIDPASVLCQNCGHCEARIER